MALSACNANISGNSLAGTSWALKSYGNITNMIPVLPETKAITLEFNEELNHYGGFDGYINSYGGECKIKGNTISIGVRTSTQIQVPDKPPGFAKQVSTYFNLLSQAKSFSITNDELTITCSSSQVLLFSHLTQ